MLILAGYQLPTCASFRSCSGLYRFRSGAVQLVANRLIAKSDEVSGYARIDSVRYVSTLRVQTIVYQEKSFGIKEDASEKVSVDTVRFRTLAGGISLPAGKQVASLLR